MLFKLREILEQRRILMQQYMTPEARERCIIIRIYLNLSKQIVACQTRKGPENRGHDSPGKNE